MPFLNKTSKDVGTVPVTVYSVPTGLESIVLEMDVCNVSQIGVSVTVEFFDDSESQVSHIVKNLPVPTGASIRVIAGQKIVMNGDDEIRVYSNTADSIDVVFSVLEAI